MQNMAGMYKSAWTNTHAQYCAHKRRQRGDRYAARHEALAAAGAAERERAASEAAAAAATAASLGGGAARPAHSSAAAPHQAAATHAGVPQRALAAQNLQSQPRAAIPLSPASRAAAQQAAARTAAGVAVAASASASVRGGSVNLTALHSRLQPTVPTAALPADPGASAEAAAGLNGAASDAEAAVPPPPAFLDEEEGEAVATGNAVYEPAAVMKGSELIDGDAGAPIGPAAQAATAETEAAWAHAEGVPNVAGGPANAAESGSGDVDAEQSAGEPAAKRARGPQQLV